jgi:multidrug efflux pump subunit AcrA (membrane-fusion protein)
VVSVDKRAHVLAIPREALHAENGAHFVYRVADGEVKKTLVETGLTNAMSVEIRSGLTAKDAVVLHAEGDQPLRNGMRVSTKE